MPRTRPYSGESEHSAFIDELIGERPSLTVLCGMSPQQPTASMARMVSWALDRGTHLTLWVGDVEGGFDFLDDAGEDALRGGRLTVGSYAGAVPRRLAPFVEALDLTLWETDRSIARGDLTFDLCLLRAAGDVGRLSFGRAAGILPTAMLRGIPAGVELSLTEATSPAAEVDSSVWDRATVWIDDRPSAPVHETHPPNHPVRSRIAALAASIVPTGTVLQIGIGSLAEEIVRMLGPERGVRFHTGSLPLAARELVGHAAGDRSASDPRHIATSIAPGRALDWPSDVRLRPVAHTHDPDLLATLGGLTAVNSAVNVDLSGAVNAEWIGQDRIGRGGGHRDFCRAAATDPLGRSVVVLPSRTGRGTSRIVPIGSQPNDPTTPSEYVDFVVTEWGIADLRGLTSGERGRALAAVAHPDDRALLRSPEE
jgi:4-hydroxybutyrate CoA-transferase